jgi:hypothetical protein
MKQIVTQRGLEQDDHYKMFLDEIDKAFKSNRDDRDIFVKTEQLLYGFVTYVYSFQADGQSRETASLRARTLAYIERSILPI